MQSKKPRLLDLFCGGGGCSVGYFKAGFRCYGVDNDPKPLRHYPFPYLCMDALEAMDRLLRGEGLTFSNGETLHLGAVVVFHASPPCQAYCDNNITKKTVHPELIKPIRERLVATSQPYVIENVQKAPLRSSLMLCGTMFDLRVIRHRYFELSFSGPFSPYSCNHWGTVINADFAPVYGRGSKGRRYIEVDENGKRVRRRVGRGLPPPNGWNYQQWFSHAMGIDWMPITKELTEAIPPAYTEYLGKYLISAVLSPLGEK